MKESEKRRSLFLNNKNMVQDQLVEYVSSQLKLGISRDSVKSALVGVGWAPLDVEDTLKKVEGATAPVVSAQPQVQPRAAEPVASPAASPKFVSFSGPGNIVGQAKNPEPQTIRVSDLVSASAVSAPKIVANNVDVGRPVAKSTPFKAAAVVSAMPGQAKKGMGRWAGIAVAVVLIVIFGGGAVYLFLQNKSLTSQLEAANGQGQVASQNLVGQMQAINASNTALSDQVASLTAANQALMLNLSFLALPAGSSSSTATATPLSVDGILSAGLGKNTYIITTPYGIKVSVRNSSAALVASTLQPLLGTTVTASGTYLPGLPIITIESVNGTSVIPAPVVVATSTPAAATTTAPTASSTTK
jgi:hypothetical protein